MFRGFRWQFLAVLPAILIFAFALAYRGARQTAVPESTPVKPTATSTESPSTALQQPTSSALPATPTTPLWSSDTAAFHAGYREGLVGNMNRLNPVFAHLNSVDRDISSLIFEGLFASNDYGVPVTRLAKEVVVSGDGLEYVLTLRSDVKWQDGIALSADDVIYTMSLLSDPAYAEYSLSSTFWQTVETQKLSDHLVRFRLAQPHAGFTNLLTIGILPEHALRGTGLIQLAQHPFNLSPIGTGPFQLESLHTDELGKIIEVRLQAAPVYFQRPGQGETYQIQRLNFLLFSSPQSAVTAYRSRQIDSLATVGNRDQLLFMPNSRLYTQLSATLKILIFNWDEPLFQDRRVRQALALGLDIPIIVERHFASSVLVADSPLIPGMSAYQPDAFWAEQDSEQAAILMAAATGIRAEVDDIADEDSVSETDAPTSLILIVEDQAPLVGLANDIATGWRTLGLQIEVAAQSADQHLNRLQSGEFQAAIVTQHIGANPDVYRFWHPAQASSGFNYGKLTNHEIAELLESARAEGNGIVRQQLYQQFQQTFAEQAIAIPLFYPIYTMAIRDTFEGIRLSYLGTPADRFRGIADWRRSTLAG